MADLQTDASTYHMGLNTLRISRKALHGGLRSRVLEVLRKDLSGGSTTGMPGVLLLQAGGPFHVYSTDGELTFKQESYMHYLFGVQEEDWYGAIDLNTGQAHLFMPRLPAEYAVWMGPLQVPQDALAKYAVDSVHYADEMSDVLKQLLAAQGSKGPKLGPLFVLAGINSDSGRPTLRASFKDMQNEFEVEPDAKVFQVVTNCRTVKSPEEVAILRYANVVGSAGHVKMMRKTVPGITMEYQLESEFLHHCYANGGCRTYGYTPICASGPNGATLHYGHAGAPNDREVQAEDMMLVDMGCEYYRYGSDITCCWPASGKFSQKQRLVYEAVLRAHTAVIAALRPGVAWPEMHTLAYRIILEDLSAGGLLRGSVEDMLAANVGALFMPHGLGHFLGIDTHDVGGYLPGNPERSTRPGYKSLRTSRSLKCGNVITVEPGCYFNFPALLNPAFENPAVKDFLVKDAIMAFVGFGGVRIEDNVVVTETGAESLTLVPRTVDDIEAVMAGAPWQGKAL